jgi:hypothetical protein
MSLLENARRLRAEKNKKPGLLTLLAENEQPDNRIAPFADIADKPPKKLSANLQPIEIDKKDELAGGSETERQPVLTGEGHPREALEILGREHTTPKSAQFADIAACMRKREFALGSIFNSISSLSRAREQHCQHFLPAVLPDSCPCWEWSWPPWVEKRCAFSRPLLHRLATAGIVPDDEGRCPLLGACGLLCVLNG